jgi:hypothetical protein
MGRIDDLVADRKGHAVLAFNSSEKLILCALRIAAVFGASAFS